MIRSLSINARILLAALLPAIGIVILLSTYFVRSQLIHLDQALDQRGQVIASQLAQAAEYGVFSGNNTILVNLANALLVEQDVMRITISNVDDAILVDMKNSIDAELTDNNHLVFSSNIHSSNVTVSDFDESLQVVGTILLGKVQVILSKQNTIAAKRKILLTSLFIALLVLSIGSLFALQTGRSLARPLHHLTRAVSAVASGKLETRVEQHSKGELGELEQGFNTMASALQEAQQELQRQVDAATRELRETLEAVEIQNVQLDLARRHALDVSKEKTAFLANMSHEIRTPMNGLLGFIDLLLRTPLNGEQREYTSTIRKSAANLLIIVNDILDFSKIESNKLVIDSQPFNLREALEDSVDLMAPVAHEKNLELVLLIYSDVPLNLFGDSNRIRQILLNLIGNAIKFTESGTVTVRVMLDEVESSIDTCPAIRFSVTDTGIGLSEAQQQHLFKAFSQLDNSPAKRHGGTGLGLFISRNLVEAMHGRIGIESKLGQGANFWFSLPLEVQRNVATQAGETTLDTPLNALVYDPHDLARLALRHPLEEWGFKVKEASSREKLFERIQSARFDIIILGLTSNTPEETERSHQFLAQVNQYGMPVIAMVSEIEHDRLQQWRDSGASVCITKPTRRELLHRTLWQVLQLPEEDTEEFIDRRNTPRPVMPNLTGATFLLADDNEINRKLISLQLESLGVHVDCAINGEEAISLTTNKHYDLILMDLHMPGMSGDESAREIRRHNTLNQSTPIIAITANVFLEETQNLRAHGINDYLTKPISEYSLWDMIKRWIGREMSERPAKAIPGAESLLSQRPEILKELLNLLRKDLPDQRRNIARAFERKDWKALRQHAHKLNGSAAYCKADRLRSAAAKLEKAAYEEDVPMIENAYVQCNQAIEQLINDCIH